MMKAFQGENSSGKGGRTKGNIKKKKKNRELELKVIGNPTIP